MSKEASYASVVTQLAELQRSRKKKTPPPPKPKDKSLSSQTVKEVTAEGAPSKNIVEAPKVEAIPLDIKSLTGSTPSSSHPLARHHTGKQQMLQKKNIGKQRAAASRQRILSNVQGTRTTIENLRNILRSTRRAR